MARLSSTLQEQYFMKEKVQSGLLLPLFMLLLGCGLCVFPIIRYVIGNRTEYWRPTVSTVISASATSYPINTAYRGTIGAWTLSVDYRYVVGNRIFDSQFLSYKHISHEIFAKVVRKGVTLSAYYNPDDPSEAVLFRGTRPLTASALFIIGAISAMIGLMALIINNRR